MQWEMCRYCAKDVSQDASIAIPIGQAVIKTLIFIAVGAIALPLE
jgi:hypothetical protein